MSFKNKEVDKTTRKGLSHGALARSCLINENPKIERVYLECLRSTGGACRHGDDSDYHKGF